MTPKPGLKGAAQLETLSPPVELLHKWYEQKQTGKDSGTGITPAANPIEKGCD